MTLHVNHLFNLSNYKRIWIQIKILSPTSKNHLRHCIQILINLISKSSTNPLIFPFCRRLCVAGNSGHVILFKFRKLESVSETLVLEIPITYENFDDAESPECEFVPRSLPKQPDSTENDKKVGIWAQFVVVSYF